MNFAKVYESILDSSIWLEPDHVLRVFVALLVKSDPRGHVEMARGMLARRAFPRLIPHNEAEADRLCAEALSVLAAPDPRGKEPTFRDDGYDELRKVGCRIAPIPGGWIVLNRRAYWEKGSSAPRVRAHRARVKGESVTDVTPVTPSLLSSSSTEELQREREMKRDVTPPRYTLLAVGELVQQIRGLAIRPTPTGTPVIPKAAIEALGVDIYRAYEAVGGTTRFLAATGKDYSFLVREFGQMLAQVATTPPVPSVP